MLFALLNIVLAVGSAHAQSIKVTADIPFDFVVNKEMLHAGSYTIQPIDTNGRIVMLRSADMKQAVLLPACIPVSEAGSGSDNKLVFKAVGGHYYLWQIWTSGYDTGSELPVQPLATDVQLASVPTQSPVIIAASLRR